MQIDPVFACYPPRVQLLSASLPCQRNLSSDFTAFVGFQFLRQTRLFFPRRSRLSGRVDAFPNDSAVEQSARRTWRASPPPSAIERLQSEAL